MFALSDLHSLCTACLSAFGLAKTVNKTRLKTSLLEYFPQMKEQQQAGRKTILIFSEGMKQIIHEAWTNKDYNEDARALSRVAKLLRDEIFTDDSSKFKFTDSFTTQCHEKSVPPILKSFMSMILYGSNVSDGIMSDSQTCLTLCQIISFNAKKKATHSFIAQPVDNRHCRDREPPLPIYIGLSIHTATRSKTLVNQLAQLGLSIKYDRVMELETTMAVSSCAHFMSIGVVCPPPISEEVYSLSEHWII